MKTNVVAELYLDGVTPQKVIRRMNDIINRTPQKMKQNLRIQEYDENFGNPFSEPVRCLRVILLDS